MTLQLLAADQLGLQLNQINNVQVTYKPTQRVPQFVSMRAVSPEIANLCQPSQCASYNLVFRDIGIVRLESAERLALLKRETRKTFGEIDAPSDTMNQRIIIGIAAAKADTQSLRHEFTEDCSQQRVERGCVLHVNAPPILRSQLLPRVKQYVPQVPDRNAG